MVTTTLEARRASGGTAPGGTAPDGTAPGGTAPSEGSSSSGGGEARARPGCGRPRSATAHAAPAAEDRADRRLRWDDAGMATAEYAIATVAAAGFAGLLIAILRSDEVRGLLLGIVRGALST